MFIIHSCSCIFQILCHSLLGWHQCMCAHHVWSARSVRNLNFHNSTLLFYMVKIVTIYKLLCILNASVMVMLLTHILLQPSRFYASAYSIESVKVVMLLTLLHILVAFMTAMLLMFLHILVAFMIVMLLTAIHQRCACWHFCIFYCIF